MKEKFTKTFESFESLVPKSKIAGASASAQDDFNSEEKAGVHLNSIFMDTCGLSYV